MSQNPRHLFSDSLTVAWQSLWRETLSATDTSRTIRSSGSYNATSVAAFITAWTCWKVFPYSGPHWKLEDFMSLSKWARTAQSNEEYVVFNIETGPRRFTHLFWLYKKPDVTIHSLLQKGNLNMPYATGPLEISQRLRPLNIFLWFSRQFFRPVLGSQQNWGKDRGFPIHTLPQDMHRLSHYQNLSPDFYIYYNW